MPTSHYKRRQTLLACACLSSLAAGAADLRFTTIISDQNANIAFPNLPASYIIASSSAAISDVGNADMGVFLSNAAAGNGHWAQVESSWRQFAAINTSNATGPGRTGAESGHVFFEWDGVSDSAGSNIRTFIGRAGSPLQPSSVATWGMYAFNGLANVEVARGGNVGALGPNLATGWQFNTSRNPFDRIIPQANGRVVISAQVDSPSNTFIPAVVLHVPGFGNRGCAATGLTGPLAPGVGLTFNELRWVVAASDGPVYMHGAQVNGSFVTAEGIWAICEGAPSVKALAKVTGVRGPGLPASTAIFNTIQNFITTAGGDSFHFGASGQETAGAGAVPFDGIFRHDGTANAPVALRSVQGELGPKVAGFVFSQFGTIKVQAAASFGLLRATVNDVVTPTDSREGLWRTTASSSAQPIALVNATGSLLAPSATRRWVNFQNEAIFANGDVLTIATTALLAGGDQKRGLWRLRPNRAPESMMAIGDRVTLTTASGPQLVAITDIETVLSSSGPIQLYSGDDSWASADGSVIVGVNLAGFSSTSFFVRGLATDLSVLLADGFE